ncbi:MAG: histidinol dehydrogenase, partial [Fibrobacter sp.]|nr:histidinol dehydrogenase [Fibrobacter sp.]
MLDIIDAGSIDKSFFSSRRLGGIPEVVPQILESVLNNGDSALREYAAKFDRANPSSFEIPNQELIEAKEKLAKSNPELFNSLCLSYNLALKFAKRQRESFNDFEDEISPGLFTGQKTLPVDRAGFYVPAGRYPLFSSVIMCSAPAKAACVKETILCTPPAQH